MLHQEERSQPMPPKAILALQCEVLKTCGQPLNIFIKIPEQKGGTFDQFSLRKMVGKMTLQAGSAPEEGTEGPQFFDSRQKHSRQ